MTKFSMCSSILLTFLVASCDYNDKEDYNPKTEFKAYVASLEEAKSAKADAGEEADPAALAAAEAKKNYGLFCVSCHGADGKANSGAALAMNPKPRNLTDAAWQESVDDAHLVKVLQEGGAAVGLSVTMPAWGASMSDEQIDGLVAYIRSLKGA